MKLSDEVYENLKGKILDLSLPPGTPLQESQITRDIGASRTPVRAALQQLSRDGLVRLVPGMGAFVSDISIADVTEMFGMREALESYAASLAARSERRESLSSFIPRLSEFLDKFDGGASPAALAEAMPGYYALTAELDEAIVELAGNSRLTAALRQLWGELRRARRLASSRPSRLEESIPEHVAIVEAIVAGDAEAAEASMSLHVNHSLHHIHQNLLTNVAGTGFLTLSGLSAAR